MLAPNENPSTAEFDRPPQFEAVARRRVRWLSFRTHRDAFFRHPFRYVQGMWWRSLGLKLRARHRFAALLGKSRSAFELWILRDEPGFKRNVLPTIGLKPVPIQFVIDTSGDCREIEATLQSLIAAGLDLPPMTLGKSSGIAQQFGLRAACRQSDVGVDWACMIQPGDRIAKDAMHFYAAAIRSSPAASVIYADDDLIDSSGTRYNPHFKPDWNGELYEHHDFLTGACIARLDHQVPTDSSADWFRSLIVAHLAAGSRPVRVTQILHHRRSRPSPHRPARLPLRAHSFPPATVIIPTRNKVELLRACLAGVGKTAYPVSHTIIIDNGSDDSATREFLQRSSSDGVEVIHAPGPFNFSALNNLAARGANDPLLCFLNNDVEMESPDWLGYMARQALRSDVGGVGAKLLYPDRTIQHAGVVTGIGGGAAHAHRCQGEFEFGYFDRANLPQWVGAVTAACLVIERYKFNAVGGFDEVNFPVAFNDVDLCLKLRARGWESLYEPRASLIHHESKSRGTDNRGEKRARFATELQALKRIWGTDQEVDPYHHPYLSRFSEQFVVAV